QVNGPGSIIFGSINVNTTFASASQYGKYVLQWTISNGICPSATDTLTIVYFETPSTANAGPDQEFCNQNTANLNAVVPAVGLGSWKVISGTSNINNSLSATTSVSNLSAGLNTFVWTLNNGPCASSSDTVVVKVDQCTIA